MRAVLSVCAMLGLAACATPVPESGVGFGDYGSYLRAREAALASGSAPPPVPGSAPVSAAPTSPAFSTERIGAAIDASERPAAPAAAPLSPFAVAGSGDAARPRGNAPAGIRVETGEVVHSNPGISDEQDFSAVSSRESIESDADRLARNRQQYQVVQPTALPTRPGNTGPNIVAFALSTTHAPGTPVYRRSGLSLTNANTACARFASPDQAQEAFLGDGGPERDRRGIDPDGDGFACSWDPRPFRTARQ